MNNDIKYFFLTDYNNQYLLRYDGIELVGSLIKNWAEDAVIHKATEKFYVSTNDDYDYADVSVSVNTFDDVLKLLVLICKRDFESDDASLFQLDKTGHYRINPWKFMPDTENADQDYE